MPTEPFTTDQLVADLHTRFTRVERAILGDPSIGHTGLVEDVRNLKRSEMDAVGIHGEIDKRRADGDKRLHDRLDTAEATLSENVRSIEKKLDRAVWLGLGGFVGGGAIGAGSVWTLLGG